MPRIIDIVIRGSDQSGPAFASAATNLARLTQGGTQATTGLARVENQATETGSAIITLGIAGSTTATRMRSLNVSIVNQEQALELAGRRLREVRAAHDADSLAVGRAQLAYDRLNRSLVNNRARMQDLRTSGDISGLSLFGLGGGAPAGPGAPGGGLIGGLGGAAGALGFAFGAAELVRFGGAAIGAANDLEKTEATLRALSGTQERYAEVLALARRNQSLYGGTTQDTLEAFRGLVPLANSANVALGSLDETVRKLAILSPEQGAQGAAIALRDFLTATGAEGAQSLQMRFELSKQGLNDIIQSTDDATERTRLLNELLADQGITQQTLAAAADTTAASYDRLGASWDRFKTTVGGALGGALEPSAIGLSGLLSIASGDFSGGLEQLYRGGNMAQGYRGAGLDQRMAAVGYGGAGPVVVQNITVQGSLVTERQVAERTRALNSQTASRNRGSIRR